MASRTEDLTDAAKPVADKLAARCGSLKKVLSAGVLALDSCSAEEREKFMAQASGLEVVIPDKKSYHEGVRLIKKSVQIENAQPGTIIKTLTAEERAEFARFRKSVGPEPKKAKKKQSGG